MFEKTCKISEKLIETLGLLGIQFEQMRCEVYGNFRKLKSLQELWCTGQRTYATKFFVGRAGNPSNPPCRYATCLKMSVRTY